MNQDVATVGAPPQGGVTASIRARHGLRVRQLRPSGPGSHLRGPAAAGRPGLRLALAGAGDPGGVHGAASAGARAEGVRVGVDVVAMVACEEDNCHYLEGSKRCARRADYLRSILNEIGLGGERLMLFHLPGTAAEDMALAAGRPAPACACEALDAQAAAIRDQVVEALRALPPNPLHQAPAAGYAEETCQEVDISYDDNEE